MSEVSYVSAFARGFGLGFSLIAAIGAQNAYLLTRSILRDYHWLVALICIVVDTVLIIAGTLGMGQLVKAWPSVIDALTLLGVVFLFSYGLISFRRLLRPSGLESRGGKVTMRSAIVTALLISLLNPHVYLDTVVLIGSIGVQEPIEARPVFVLGAIIASVIWFFGLALSGRAMQQWFRSARAWQVLDLLVAIIMWLIALSLLKRLF